MEGKGPLSGDTASSTTSNSLHDLKADGPLQFYVQDVSFAVPQRKKLTLEMTAAGGYLRARNQTSKEIEFGILVKDIREFLFFLPPLSGRFSCVNLFQLFQSRKNIYYVFLCPRKRNVKQIFV